MIDPSQIRRSLFAPRGWSLLAKLAATSALSGVALLNPWLATAQAASSQIPAAVSQGTAIRGIVMDAVGRPVVGVVVHIASAGDSFQTEAVTDASGAFAFSRVPEGSYTVSAEKASLGRRTVSLTLNSGATDKKIDLVLEQETESKKTQGGNAEPSDAMEFADKPNFTIAGVTDWTAVGGHGSDAILRTSENLARETSTLKPEDSRLKETAPSVSAGESAETESKLRKALADAPASLDANRQLGEFYFRKGNFQQSIPLLREAYRLDPADYACPSDLAIALKEVGEFAQSRELIQKLLALDETAALHRLAGEVDEKTDDPLMAVREFEKAVRLDPNEQNYFEWGSELLLHRAVWQAQEVFARGAEAYPKSARMLSAWAAALFAGARYDDAAARLCEASDSDPADEEPYLWMGKIELAAPHPLECVEKRLQRYLKQNPENSAAYYFYAMAIWKRQPQPPDSNEMQEVEALLDKAVLVDSKCSDAFLQLGVLSFSRKQYEKAAEFYSRAIEANPQSGEAHYRLGIAYDHLGEPAKAKEEFRLHDAIETAQAAATEEQRRQVKQFLVVLEDQSKNSPIH
jgi:tetratricopeptide (TPR) repeat protein